MSVRVGEYLLFQKIGSGSYGKVKLAVHQPTGNQVAVKILDKSEIKANSMTLQVKREVAIMKALDHPHIVRLHEVLASPTKLYLVMDLVTGGELFDIIAAKGEGGLDENEARRLFQHMVDAVDYCHKRGVYHRDLKPENMLLDEEGILKITDFGLSAIRGAEDAHQLLETQCGTPSYIAPEIIRASGGYEGAKVDAWACGIILFALLAGYLPFEGGDSTELFISIQTAHVEFPDWIKPGPRNLISKLLEKNPKDRYTLKQVKKDPWFVVGYDGDDAPHKVSRPVKPISLYRFEGLGILPPTKSGETTNRADNLAPPQNDDRLRTSTKGVNRPGATKPPEAIDLETRETAKRAAAVTEAQRTWLESSRHMRMSVRKGDGATEASQQAGGDKRGKPIFTPLQTAAPDLPLKPSEFGDASPSSLALATARPRAPARLREQASNHLMDSFIFRMDSSTDSEKSDKDSLSAMMDAITIEARQQTNKAEGTLGGKTEPVGDRNSRKPGVGAGTIPGMQPTILPMPYTRPIDEDEDSDRFADSDSDIDDGVEHSLSAEKKEILVTLRDIQTAILYSRKEFMSQKNSTLTAVFFNLVGSEEYKRTLKSHPIWMRATLRYIASEIDAAAVQFSFTESEKNQCRAFLKELEKFYDMKTAEKLNITTYNFDSELLSLERVLATIDERMLGDRAPQTVDLDVHDSNPKVASAPKVKENPISPVSGTPTTPSGAKSGNTQTLNTTVQILGDASSAAGTARDSTAKRQDAVSKGNVPNRDSVQQLQQRKSAQADLQQRQKALQFTKAEKPVDYTKLVESGEVDLATVMQGSKSNPSLGLSPSSNTVGSSEAASANLAKDTERRITDDEDSAKDELKRNRSFKLGMKKPVVGTWLFNTTSFESGYELSACLRNLTLVMEAMGMVVSEKKMKLKVKSTQFETATNMNVDFKAIKAGTGTSPLAKTVVTFSKDRTFAGGYFDSDSFVTVVNAIRTQFAKSNPSAVLAIPA
mmetsp:Transcript_14943/g.25939  ORF Transcript_14943/g.25939 Transcript_14943/m.25939 type:complete len:993 (+) Transcript_14943:150-3128(+)